MEEDERKSSMMKHNFEAHGKQLQVRVCGCRKHWDREGKERKRKQSLLPSLSPTPPSFPPSSARYCIDAHRFSAASGF